MQISLCLSSNYPLIRKATTLYVRYINDIIHIWSKSGNEILTFFEKLKK